MGTLVHAYSDPTADWWGPDEASPVLRDGAWLTSPSTAIPTSCGLIRRPGSGFAPGASPSGRSLCSPHVCAGQGGIDKIQVAYAEVDLGGLEAHPSRENRNTAVPELPATGFDLSLVVADEVTWSQVERVTATVDDLISEVGYVGEYRGAWVPDGTAH